jgi:hypothetical protein
MYFLVTWEMAGWMCGAWRKNRTTRVELTGQEGMEYITHVVRKSKLWWLGLLKRKV